MSNVYYDNTKLSDYKKCPRYYYLRHERGWRKPGISMPLVFGLSWHDAMDTVWQGFGKVSNTTLVDMAMEGFAKCWEGQGMKPIHELDYQELEMLGARSPMTAKIMLGNYIEQRHDILTNMKLLAAERPFAVPLYHNRTDIWYIGRRDKDISLNGDTIVIEHKTTSEYKIDGGFKQSYLEGWYPNSQCEGYLFAGNLEYQPKGVRYVWVDAALVHKKVHDKFKFIPVSSTFASMDAWLWEAKDWVGRIQSEQERISGSESQKILTAYPKNTEQCNGKYGLCGFLDVCRGYANPAQLEAPPNGYIHDVWNPFDLLHISELKLTDA